MIIATTFIFFYDILIRFSKSVGSSFTVIEPLGDYSPLIQWSLTFILIILVAGILRHVARKIKYDLNH